MSEGPAPPGYELHYADVSISAPLCKGSSAVGGEGLFNARVGR